LQVCNLNLMGQKVAFWVNGLAAEKKLLLMK
jgi:hypothetical protein